MKINKKTGEITLNILEFGILIKASEIGLLPSFIPKDNKIVASDKRDKNE